MFSKLRKLNAETLIGYVRYALWCIRYPGFRSKQPIYLGGACRIRLSFTGRVTTRGGCVIRSRGTLVVNGSLELGKNVFFNCDSYISVKGRVRVGDDVRFGERVSIHDSDHVFEPIPVVNGQREADLVGEVTIGDRVWVGANSVILRGSQIGNDVVVGAGSIVKGVVPSGVLVAGAPAKILRKLSSSEIGA